MDRTGGGLERGTGQEEAWREGRDRTRRGLERGTGQEEA